MPQTAQHHCALVEHHPDGSTTVRTWAISPDVAARIADWLGQPHQVQMLTPEQAADADRLAEQAITLD